MHSIRSVSGCLCALLGLASVSTAQGPCAPNSIPLFDFQLGAPAAFLSGDTTRVTIEPSRRSSGSQDIVQFVVDTNGLPQRRSLKIIQSRDTALVEAFRAAIAAWRFTPARSRDGCKASQGMIAGVRWTSSGR